MRTLEQICVSRRPGTKVQGILRAGHLTLPCVLGRSGIRAVKREGDGASPRGVWHLREAFVRADRWGRRLPVGLPQRVLKMSDGWCDATHDRNYNRLIQHPYPASAEHLWRDDALYDAIVVVGYNDRPRMRAAGSAIFMHLANEDASGFRPTEGCVALRRRDLSRLLPFIGVQTRIRIGV
ncbi:MAG: L,D-transpeptidase family protein [Filomicrobium sp.]